jgi:transketolase
MTDRHGFAELEKLATLVSYYSLAVTTKAGSGHPSSSLSATDLMVGLMFGGTFRYDVDRPEHPNNDRLVFSKGHASPLFYALWLAAGKLSDEEMMTYREFGSPLEGHPTVAFPYTEAATGSLGQGLPIGVGLALNARYLDKLPYRTYVLLGDSEMAEGSQWEAMQLAAHYGLSNLIGILDVNRLGQRGETMYGWDLDAYHKRITAFGWDAIEIDGHDFGAIFQAYARAAQNKNRPMMIIARTVKGKGVPLLEDQDGWHGKVLDEAQFEEAVKALGPVDKSIRGTIPKPEDLRPRPARPSAAGATGVGGAAVAAAAAESEASVAPSGRRRSATKAAAGAASKAAQPAASGARAETAPEPTARPEPASLDYPKDTPVGTRHAFGNALVRLYPKYPEIVSVDGEVSNSTGADRFKKAYPDRFFEMYIAEQNMAGVALGLSRRDKIPFASTFAAFWTRAFDQIRMSRYSDANIKFVGSHAGVSIGQDGPSQMGLEDIAMFRSVLDSVVLHPCDAISTERLVEEMVHHRGIVYLRTLRQETPILYDPDEPFPIGGCKVLRRSAHDVATVIGAGATVWEALAAYDELSKEGIEVRVIDLYSIKPLEEAMLRAAAEETGTIITVEDHYAAGGMGEAVLSALYGAGARGEGARVTGGAGKAAADAVPADVHILAVRRKPMSGSGPELRDFEGISAKAIVEKVKELTSRRSPRLSD